ncbi:CNH domain-containing protein [Melanogaster broomeanus]|nr:CNH domain-containing protein [Melanogaster broomeanus]
MDRPAGPRQPDKRNEAYELIFGRAPATHHHHPVAQHYAHRLSSHNYYQQSIDRRTSHPSSFAPQQNYYNPPQQPPYRQSFHSPTSQPHLPPSSHYQHQPQFPHRPHALAPPAPHGRAPSFVSGHHAAGIIAPRPEDPPDAGLEALTRTGLTPAQAYQAQVYSNNPRVSDPQNGGPSRPPEDVPRLEVIDPDIGRLSIDFGTDDQTQDDSYEASSELPWAQTPEHTPTTVRRSSDSARTLPPPRRDRPIQDRSMSMSMSAASNSMRTVVDARSRQPIPQSLQGGQNSPTTSTKALAVRTHSPIVYPALLSRVAEAFKERVAIADRVKDGLTYTDAFDGREAVDKIAYIIKTTDRNLALLLGRALDAQKFFHDVTYDHRLRDSAAELYQFRTKLSPFGSESAEEFTLPSGVFTLLTDCYSPTCSRDQLCYSIACPRRLEQQSRLNMKPQPGLKKQLSRESLGDFVEPGTLWIHSVPQEVVNSVSDAEKRRQEAINEVIYTERDFVRDMEYLRDVWMNNLKDSDIVPADRRTDFIQQVFWNIHEIIAVNTRLRDALNKRQKSYAVVERIGDILLDAVPHFGPFVSYGAHQLYGKYEFEKEKSSNPAFAAFVETTERLPESRKLELNGYLTKPTTRLARYPLLLEAVLKHTPEENPDKQALAQAVVIVRDFLGKVNVETGKTENRFNLLQLDQQLVYRPGEQVDLKLQDPSRELVYKGTLNKRGGTQGDSGDLLVYLFDHALLMVKQKSKHEQYKVYRRPIPLELLFISAQSKELTKKALTRGAPYPLHIPIKVDGKGDFAVTFVHLGRKFYQITLWASTFVSHRKWVDTIMKHQEMLRERSMVFDTATVCEAFFLGSNKVNCAAPFAHGRRIAYGTDDGVYLSDLREQNRDPVKVLALLDVSQVDVLEEFQLLIVLSERQVITFPLDALDSMDPMAGLKRAKRISSHTSFFKAGICLGKTLVCVVKSSPLSSTIKTLEPIDQNIRGRSKPTFRKLLQGGNDTLKLFREFYIPVESSSIHFLKTKLCVGCSKGFEIVDLESLDTQGLLDPADESGRTCDPMAIYRIENEFLLFKDAHPFSHLHSEFAFYVNKNGWRSRPNFMVHWEGSPTGFALRFPYVLAFEPTFVEIRHVETGLMYHRLCMDVGYGSPPPMGYPQYPRYPPSGRDEILIVSDDRVLTLRFAGNNVHVASDTASLASSR